MKRVKTAGEEVLQTELMWETDEAVFLHPNNG